MDNDVLTAHLSRRTLLLGGAAAAGAVATLNPLSIARAARSRASSNVTVTMATSATWVADKGLHGGPLYTELAATLKAQTGITLNVVGIPENSLYDKINLDVVSGAHSYDLIATGAGGAKQFGLAGRLLPLPTPKDIADFFPGDVSQYSVGKNFFGYPMVTDTNVFYWRTDLLKKAGLDASRPPQTLNEVRQHAIALTVDTKGRHPGDAKFDASNVAVYGSNFKGVAGLACTWEWYNYLFEFGGEVLSNGTYQIIVDQDPAIEALQWVVDNYRKYKIYPQAVPTFDYTEFAALWYDGKVATCLNWPYMYSASQDPSQSKIKGLFSVGLRPGKVTHGGELGGWSVSVLKQTPHPDEAIVAAAFLTSVTAQTVYAGPQMGSTPARKSLFKSLIAKEPQLYNAISANLAHGKGLNLLVTGPSWTPCETVLEQAIQKALVGSATPKRALSDARSSIAAILKRNRFYDQLSKIS